ncbi:MAG: hypothetical protein ABSF83_13715 [Nitrososphaerales archaeon]|jgi:hypothetical protein
MESGGKTTTETRQHRPPASVRLAVVAVFASLIAMGTFFSVPVPQPLYEITWAPAIYLALAVLTDSGTAFSATAIGGFLGEAINVAYKAGGSPIYPFGMVWARGPEVFIVIWGARKGRKWLAASMVIATVFETLAFFFPDWLFYTYGLFQYGSPESTIKGLIAALPDMGTMVDLAWIPVAFGIVYAAAPAFRRLGFRSNLQEPKQP